MKRSSNKQTADVLEKKLRNLSTELLEYNQGDFDALCSMSQTVVMAYEYWVFSKKKPILRVRFQQELNNWFRTIFQEHPCLVLKFDDKFFSYSRRYLVKFLRGAKVHSDQKNKDLKHQALKAFIFEDDGSHSSFEFAVTHNWIITGGVGLDIGNLDSKNLFKERIKLGEREEFIGTTLESIVFNIIAEFDSIAHAGQYINSGRILENTKLSDLSERFGKEVGNQCFKVVEWHRQHDR
jgi:hypothetical protein